MSRLKTLAQQVEKILEEYPVARENDRELIRIIYARCYGISYYMNFGEVMGRKDLPSFESIRRTRQKIQQHNEALRGTKQCEDARLAKQEEYLEFAREGA